MVSHLLELGTRDEGEKLPLMVEEELIWGFGPVVPEGDVETWSADGSGKAQRPGPHQGELGPRCSDSRWQAKPEGFLMAR